MSWDSVVPPFSANDRARVIEDVAGQLQNYPWQKCGESARNWSGV